MENEFKVETPEAAAEVMRKYRRLAQRQQQNKALAEAERIRIDAWLQRANEPLQSKMDWYAGHLEAYAHRERLEGRKSVTLPDGDIKTRQTSPTVDVDKSVFVEWAQEEKREDLLRVSFAPDMTAIKTSVVVDGGSVVDPVSGEVIPGLSPVPERVSVTITPDLDAIDLEGIEGEDVE